jgi:hypothetical protein
MLDTNTNNVLAEVAARCPLQALATCYLSSGVLIQCICQGCTFPLEGANKASFKIASISWSGICLPSKFLYALLSLLIALKWFQYSSVFIRRSSIGFKQMH